MKRIIISGASGFLGSQIIESAQEMKDVEIVAISTKNIECPDVTVINTEEFLENGASFSEEDVFINCMFPTNADGFRMAEGLKKVYRLIQMAYKSGVGAFINVSSQSVYASKRTTSASETDDLCLESPYAVGKYSTEEYTNQVFSDRFHTNIRLASLLGVGYDQRIVNRMIIQALNGAPLKVVGGMQRYGFLDVRDAASGLVRLVASNASEWKNEYNLGRNDSCSLIDVVNSISSEVKRLAGLTVNYTISEGLDDRNSAIDASRFMNDFNWCAKYTLAQTIANIINSKLDEVE